MTRHRHRGSANRSTTYHPDQSGYSAVPSPVANDGCLSSRADFIPSWLHHMQACHNDPPQDIPQQKRPIDSTNLSWHPNGLTTVRIQPSCDTGRYQSSDNFIQGSPSQSSLPDQRCHHQYRQSALDSDHGQNLDDRERHHHSIQPTSTTSETSLTRNNVFEKQPRRKTRRDRYDTVKSKAERTEGGHRKKPWTRVTKKGRLRSSREVMTNFSSRAIANASEKITLEQKFTPGLFVNGRSSTSSDLAFNDIPLNHENVETCEKGHPSNPEPKQRERRKSRQDEIKIFADALKRLIADYPPPKSASPPNRTIVSSGACTQRINGDSNGRLLQRGSHTPRSLSIRSHPTAVISSRNFTPEARGRPTTDKELTAVISCEDHKPHGHEAIEPPRYEDKGIMVSPWMHQRAAENISYGTASADHQLRPRQGESSNSRAEIHMSSAYLETSAPEVSGKCQPERFRFKASGVEDVIHPRDNIPPMPYFNGTSSRYSIDWPAKPMVAKQIYQPHQEAFQELIQELNTVSRKSLEIVDDIPGETLKEYIERMEREILGQSELSAPCTDEAMPPSEANIFDNGRRPIKCLRKIEYNDDLPRRDQPHEAAHSFARRYPRPYHAEESPAESESAFFWRPNHMMWC
ncbi:hypothetical protein FP744_10008554 [Trichoderma asperellum]